MKNTIDIIKNFKRLSSCERLQIFAKECYLSAADYHNGQHYGRLTDLTSTPALMKIQMKMKNDYTGCLILKEKPRIRNEALAKLAYLPQNTFGKSYYNFMSGYGFAPEERPLVNYIPDLQLAYICQRYKQIHDFLHVLIEDVVTVHNQLVIKWFQMIQLGFPSAALASLISPILSSSMSLEQAAKICRMAQKHKFIMNIYYEKHFEQDMTQFRKFLLK